MKKFFKGLLNIFVIAIKVCLLFIVVLYSYSYLNKAFKADVDHGEQFHSLPENSMDVLVLGSSHAQFSFCPSFFYEDTGLYSYVLGSACQPFEVSYQMLKEALKTQSPRLVVMEVYTAMPLRSICESDSCYVMSSYQMRNQERIDTLNYLEREKAESYYNDFINNHNEWKNLENLETLKPGTVLKEQFDLDGTFGYVYQPGIYDNPDNWWPPSVYGNTEYVELDELDLKSLEDINSLCKENDIELFLYKTPIDGVSREDQSFLEAVWRWADENDVSYYNFQDKTTSMDFFMWIHSDSFHCYVTGASIITDYLAKIISEEAIQFNHKENGLLTKTYIASGQNYTVDAVDSERNPRKYLDRLSNSSGYILIDYNPNYYGLSNSLYNKLLSLGIEENLFDREKPFLAILKDNELLDYSYGDSIVKNVDRKEIEVSLQGFKIGEDYYNLLHCDITLLYSRNEFKSCVTKNIDTRYDWDYGFDSYCVY